MRRTNLTIPVSLATGLTVAFLLFFIFNRLAGELTLALQIVVFSATGAGVILALAGAYFGIGILNEKRLQAIERTHQAKEETKHKRLQTDEHKVRVLRESKMVTVAGPGDQVYLTDLLKDLTNALHLQAGQVNGHLIEPTNLEIEHWRINQLAHGRRQPALPGPDQAAQLAAGETLPPLLPLILKAQRVVIAGGSDSGKSELAKHSIAGRAADSQIIPIDPHAPSKLLGYDVIGAGRDWQTIAEALESLELLMQERYSDVAKGLMGYFQHSKVSIYIDEWPAIVEEVPEAGKRLKTLLIESRKVNMHLTLLTQDYTLDGLGLPSAQYKKSALIVELVGGNAAGPHRAFVHPQASIGPDGKKARPVEYALPGPFTGWPKPAAEVLLELPSPEIIKVQKMSDEGQSKRAMIKELYPNVGNPGKAHYEQLEALLGRAEAARKARMG